MMPPECCICHNDFLPEEGGLIYFTEDDEDIVFNKRLRQPGYTGHPSNAFWFCQKHIAKAKEIKHLTKREAFKVLKEVFK
jgi:hypothetical protein